MVASEFPPKSAGVGNYVCNVSMKLVEKGHKVTVITRGSPKNTTMEVTNRIVVYRVPFIPIYPFHVSVHGIFANSLAKLLEPELTLVHSHIPSPPFIRTSLPSIATVHTVMRVASDHFEANSPYSAVHNIARRLQSTIAYATELEILRNSDLITTISQSVALELGGYGLDPGKIIALENGVDERIYTPRRSGEPEEMYVLYVGRLDFRKGLFDLIRCGKYVGEEYPEVKFVITGEGPLQGKLKEEVRKMQLQDRIIFLGHVSRSRLIQLYQDATVFVLPSHYEGLPTVLLEAMSCGVPVVATSVSGNTEVISSGVNGLLVPPKAPRDMAMAISRLLGDEQLRQDLGKAARRTIVERYTLNKITDNLLECYKSVL